MSEPWPHQFTKNGSPKQGYNGQMWQPMVCVHCFKEYVQGLESKPNGPCPARNDKRELKRIKSE